MREIEFRVVLRVPERGNEALDFSPEHMRRCTERALEEGPDLEWIHTEVHVSHAI